MNERKLEEMNLRDAFPEMPQECHDALLRAARSVQEEKKMKRFTLRTALIAALIILATMTAALAAGDLLGWTDFLGRRYLVPKAAQEALDDTPNQSYTLGKLTFTVRQLMCDGHLAVSTVDIHTADGSPALISEDYYDAIGANGENGRAMAERLGVDPKTTWFDAARQLKLPLYRAIAILDVAPEQQGGEEMFDPLYGDDCHFVSFSLQMLKKEALGDTLNTHLFLRVVPIDLETGEEKEGERESLRVDVSIPVHGTVAEKVFAPETPVLSNGVELVNVHAEQTIAGIYLRATIKLNEEAQKAYPEEKRWELYEMLGEEWFDAAGQPYPFGMSMSGEFNLDAWPTVIIGDMIAAEEMPKSLSVSFAGQMVTLK